MTITKSLFRERCLKSLRTTPNVSKIYRDSLVEKKITQLLQGKKNQKILLYHPLSLEVNTLKLLYKLRKKHEIFLPFMVGQSFKMVPFRLPLHRKKFNIYEAGNSHKNIKNIDIAIVPVVGVDSNLQRVGFGKGMYDRFFEKLDKKPIIIFTQQILCYSKEPLCDHFDITGDIIITPKKSVINKRNYRIKNVK